MRSAKIISLVVLAFLVLTITFAPIHEVEGMGACTTCCPNEYNSAFTSFYVSNSTYTLDALHNPGGEIDALTTTGYNISMTLVTANQSISGNTFSNGSTWISTLDYGYAVGICEGGNQLPGSGYTGPNSAISVTFTNVTLCCDFPLSPETGGFSTINGSSVTYTIEWMDPTETSIGCNNIPLSSTFSCTATVTDNTGRLATSNSIYPNGTVIFTSGNQKIGSCSVPGTQVSDLCSVTVTPSTNQIVAYYEGTTHFEGSQVIASVTLPVTTSIVTTTHVGSTLSQSSTSARSSSSSLTTSLTSNSSITSTQPNSTSSVGSTSSAPPAPPPSLLSSLGQSSVLLTIAGIVVVAVVLTAIFILSRRERFS